MDKDAKEGVVIGEMAKEMIKAMENGNEGQYSSVIRASLGGWEQRLVKIIYDLRK